MNAIISIKPHFVDAIAAGKKHYEFRRRPILRRVEKFFIYATAPISALVGEFEIANVLCATPHELWEKTSEAAGITKSDFDLYFTGAIKAYALVIKGFKKYQRPIALHDAFPGAPIPQSYIYVRTADSEKFTQELLARTEV